jgi:hypothetical protein
MGDTVVRAIRSIPMEFVGAKDVSLCKKSGTTRTQGSMLRGSKVFAFEWLARHRHKASAQPLAHRRTEARRDPLARTAYDSALSF